VHAALIVVDVDRRLLPRGTSVIAKTRAPNEIDLFATTAGGIVHTSWWYEGQEWSGIANNWRPIGG